MRKTLVIVWKVFIKQLFYYEQKLSNFTILNSELRLRLDNKVEETQYLLKQFFEKNKQNQDYLNDINKNFRNIKKKNKRKLERHRNKLMGKEIDEKSTVKEPVNKNDTSLTSKKIQSKHSSKQNMEGELLS